MGRHECRKRAQYTGSGQSWTFTPADGGYYNIAPTSTSDSAEFDETTTLTVQDAPISVSLSPAGTSPDGSIGVIAAVNDPETAHIPAGFSYVWTVTKTANNQTSTFFTESVQTGTYSSISFTPDGPGTYSISVTATELDGGSQASAGESVPVYAPTLSITGTTVTNGAAYADFTVTVSPPVPWQVSVDFATADGASSPSQGYGNAEAGHEYAADVGTLAIPAEATSEEIAIGLYTATIAKPTEDFYVSIGNPQKALVSTSAGEATGWIENNIPWVVNSTRDLPAADPAANPWTGEDNALGDDHPECTLKSIIQYLNAKGGGAVDFDIPTADSNFNGSYYTITSSGLPLIDVPMNINGASQPGYPGTPNIDVVGESGGFVICAGPSTINAMAVTGSGGNAVTIENSTGHDNITACYLGIQPGGETAGSNLGYGVEITGSPSNNLSNDLISGNDLGGVYITNSSSITITACWIGTNKEGTAAVANGGDGVTITGGAQSNTIGGTTAQAGNTIAGNQGNGVTIIGSYGNNVYGNWIGTNNSSALGIGNSGDGVSISGNAGANHVGGFDSTFGNVIADNHANGVTINATAGINSVETNWIGTDKNSRTGMGNQGNGISIPAVTTGAFIGGPVASNGNVVAGNALNGIYVHGSSGVYIQANYIGTDANSVPGLENKRDGILLDNGANHNVIGVDASLPLAADANVIAGNTGNGVRITDSATTLNAVAGNYIGTDENGSSDIPNGADGVSIIGGATQNTVGGLGGLTGNVIANNVANGVDINGSNSNYVENNWIGTNELESTSIGNGGDGVLVDGGQSNYIGDSVNNSGNVIANNEEDGVAVVASGSTRLQANWIGTDPSSDVAIGNWGRGVSVSDGSTSTAIGDAFDGHGNVIANNDEDGVAIDNSSGTSVGRNWIGTDKNFTATMGNGGNGVKIMNCSAANMIGSAELSTGPIIVSNALNGIYVSGSYFVRVASCYIGTNGNSATNLGNKQDGLLLDGASLCQIGEIQNDICVNVIAGNLGNGVHITGEASQYNSVVANHIGMEYEATPVPNGLDGVLLDGGANRNYIGINS